MKTSIVVLLLCSSVFGADFIVADYSRSDAINGSAIVKIDGDHIDGSPKGFPNQPLVNNVKKLGGDFLFGSYTLNSTVPIGNWVRVDCQSDTFVGTGGFGQPFLSTGWEYRNTAVVSSTTDDRYSSGHSVSQGHTEATILFDDGVHLTTISKWQVRFQLTAPLGIEKQLNVQMKGKIGGVTELTCHYDSGIKKWRISGTVGNSQGNPLPAINYILNPFNPADILPNGMLGKILTTYDRSTATTGVNLRTAVNDGGGIGWIAKGQIIAAESPAGPYNLDVSNSGGVTILYQGIHSQF